MSRRDWFDEVFGGAAADARSKLIDEAWFGRKVGQAPGGGEHGPEWDPVLDAKLYPDRVLDEKLFDLAMQRAGTRAIEDERLKNPEPPDFDHGR